MELPNQDQIQEKDGQNNESDKVELTKEEYDRLIASDKKLWEVETQLKASTKEWQKLWWIAKVSTDNSKFIKLYKSDKKQAEEVARHFGYTAKDFYDAVVKEYGEDSWGIDVEDVDERVQQGIDKWLAEKTLKDFKEKYGIKGKLENSFNEEFNSLMDWKEWNSDEVQKQCKRALRLVSDTDEFQKEYAKANSRLAGAWISGDWRVGNGWYKPKTAYERYKEEKQKGSLFEQFGLKK